MSVQPRSDETYGSEDPGNEESFGQRAGELANDGRVAVQEKVTSGVDTGMDKAVQGLESAAEKMRSRSEDDTGVRSTVQEKAADAMERTAGYLKEHDSQELMRELEEFVKAHPIQAAAGALVAGYVLAKVVR